MREPTKNLAGLIDADNTQPSIATALLAEIAKYGVANVKRIYGDWTTDNLKGWKKVLLDLAIQPIQQFSYTVGKNATDSRMIIDAMDLLYSRSEEHTSELQSLMRISYAVFCLKKKKNNNTHRHIYHITTYNKLTTSRQAQTQNKHN